MDLALNLNAQLAIHKCPFALTVARDVDVAMPTASTAEKGAAYACRCLNVRVQADSTDQAPPPEVVSDPSFIQVFAGDRITIVSIVKGFIPREKLTCIVEASTADPAEQAAPC